MPEILTIEGLRLETLHYGTPVVLVDGIDLTLRKGEILALVGASGSGKSLTCLGLQDALPPGVRKTGGRVLVDGMATSPSSLRGRIVATILQAPRSAFNPLLTMRDHMLETLRVAGVHGIAAERQIRGAIAAVGLADEKGLGNLYPFQMSGGMLQRAMITLAAMSGAAFLVADEPTTDLDTVAQAHVLDLIESLVAERGMGCLIVTHDMGVVARFANRTAVMAEGCIVEHGPTETLFAAPRHPVTQLLIETHLSLYEAASA
jgi:nickel transport system ATP-binding protein